jgi:heptosyltransferase-2
LHPYIDEVIVFNPALKQKLEENKYDVAFDLQRNINSRKILPSNSKVFIVKKETWKKYILVHLKINLLKNIIPVYRKYLNALKAFDENTSLDYMGTNLLCKENFAPKEKYIVLSPSSKHFTKRLPSEKFVSALKNMNFKIVLTGDNNEVDRKVCNNLENAFPCCLNLCGKLSFDELAGVIKGAEFVVCNDSGIMHLAEALGKKVFVCFGSTVKEFGFYPQLTTTEVFEVLDLNCKPCSHIGRNKCPKGHFKCTQDIDVNKMRIKINEYTK